MQQHQKNARLACAWGVVLACLGSVGCGAQFDAEMTEDALAEQAADTAGNAEDGIGEASEALVQCQGASCDGLQPGNAGCKQDMIDTGVGAAIIDARGVQIGGIGLFRSPSCQTVWATTAFYPAGGARNFRVCAVRRRAADNDSSCQDYTRSSGNDSPMKFANSGKIVFGRAVVDTIATRTPDYIVP